MDRCGRIQVQAVLADVETLAVEPFEEHFHPAIAVIRIERAPIERAPVDVNVPRPTGPGSPVELYLRIVPGTGTPRRRAVPYAKRVFGLIGRALSPF